jgi:hypothetical protein
LAQHWVVRLTACLWGENCLFYHGNLLYQLLNAWLRNGSETGLD